MKSVIGLVTVLGITVGLFSCKKTINCDVPVISKVLFYTATSTDEIPDSSFTLLKYRKGSNFTQLSQAFPENALNAEVYDKSMDFPEKGVETYDFDWKVTLLPSGKVYYISDIESAGETSTTHNCTSTVTYYVDDSLYTVPGNPYSPTPYYTSDIKIFYN